MEMLYAFDSAKMKHILVGSGLSYSFTLDGLFAGEVGIPRTPRKVDVVSMLQLEDMAEIAICCSNNYTKRRIDLDRYNSWLRSLPVYSKAVLRIKRRVGGGIALQTLYIFEFGSITPYISSLL